MTAMLAKRVKGSNNLDVNQNQDLLSFASLRLCAKISCHFEKLFMFVLIKKGNSKIVAGGAEL